MVAGNLVKESYFVLPSPHGATLKYCISLRVFLFLFKQRGHAERCGFFNAPELKLLLLLSWLRFDSLLFVSLCLCLIQLKFHIVQIK